MNIAVIYYSLDGNTGMIGKMIGEQLNADLIQIKPEKETPKQGFKKYFWGGKSVLFKEKPKLLNHNVDMSKYDTLIIGTPVWANSYSPPLETFLTENTINGKSIYLYACHGGGGAKKCFEKLSNKLEGNTIKATIDFINPKINSEQNDSNTVKEFCSQIKS